MKKKIALLIAIYLLFLIANSFTKNVLSGKQESLEQKYIQKSIDIEKEKPLDTEAPVIKLSMNKISLSKGVPIDYMSFVVSVTDNIDGDLLQYVTYNTVDTSIEGNFTITYKVVDAAGNVAKKDLKVRIIPDYKYTG